jgi:hypothetical protein
MTVLAHILKDSLFRIYLKDPKQRLEDNIKVYLQELIHGSWTEFNSLRMKTISRLL